MVCTTKNIYIRHFNGKWLHGVAKGNLQTQPIQSVFHASSVVSDNSDMPIYVVCQKTSRGSFWRRHLEKPKEA